MKAKDLVALLSADPEADVMVGWTEMVRYSDLTAGEEDQAGRVDAVYKDDGKFVLSSDCYLAAEKLWP